VDRVNERFGEWQAALENAYRSRSQVRCLCTNDGVPMVVYRREIFHVRRAPNGGPAHAADCRSHALLGDTFFEEPDAILYYPESVFLVDGTYAERGRDLLESGPARRGIAKTRTSLRTLFRIVWKRAGLCRSHDRPLPWPAVARFVRKGAALIRIGACDFSDRLIVAEDRPLGPVPSPRDARRARLHLSIALVSSVRATARDILITTSSGEQIWCDDAACLSAYRATAERTSQLAGAQVVALLAIYHQNNWRCRDWVYRSVTRAWHPFESIEQGRLYEQLASERRRFSIPLAHGSEIPWAVIWDAEGGPRAIVSENASEVPKTAYPRWRWGKQRRLPRISGVTTHAALS
jgi:hypothetical protein